MPVVIKLATPRCWVTTSRCTAQTPVSSHVARQPAMGEWGPKQDKAKASRPHLLLQQQAPTRTSTADRSNKGFWSSVASSSSSRPALRRRVGSGF